MSEKSPLGRHLDSIYITKENLLEKEGNLFRKEYAPFVINKCLAKHIDTLHHAQTLNLMGDIPKDMHYEYLLYSVRPKRRFARSRKMEMHPDIELIQQHYKYNYRRACEVVQILNKEQMAKIRAQYREQDTDG